jgi:hypothetical protein
MKMQHGVPCTDNVDGKKLGEMYIKEVFRLHGPPETIVSDWGATIHFGIPETRMQKIGN